MKAAKFDFRDTSGGGFGSLWEVKGERDDTEEAGYCFRIWDDMTSTQSSNYRELKNLTETLELMSQNGELQGTEWFVQG